MPQTMSNIKAMNDFFVSQDSFYFLFYTAITKYHYPTNVCEKIPVNSRVH